jgi:hypothetical protein
LATRRLNGWRWPKRACWPGFSPFTPRSR